MEADAVLDCTGLYCPMPIIETTDKIKELEMGQILEVIGIAQLVARLIYRIVS